jgi:porphobilinogen synthase
MSHKMAGFPQIRLRRLRQHPTLRAMLAAPLPRPERFVYPVFVVPGINRKEAIDAMPGQHRWSVDRLPELIELLAANGIGAVMLFGVIPDDAKTPNGAYALRSDGVVPRAAAFLKEHAPDLFLFSDICVCEYTSHGHCGVLAGDAVANDPSLRLLSGMAEVHAAAGVDAVAPSAMMDGQVRAIRAALDDRGFIGTSILAYSTKFASAMYGPFRAAAGSAPNKGDRKGYQADYGNCRAALRESAFDAVEGADMLMVKPALFYLDVIAQVRAATDLPVVCYNVSGEYAMLLASADRGWGDLRDMVRESVSAMDRAGCDLIISYWAIRYRELLGD